MNRTSACAVAFLALLTPGVASAEGIYIYPQQGQSAEQQAGDKSECYRWATGETGFDPAAPPPQAAAPAPTGGLVRGAARGALLGVTVGAIAGDAGQGAAIGAAAGGLGGAMRKRDNQMVADQQNQQIAAQTDAKRAEHKRAMTACLEARGYSVK